MKKICPLCETENEEDARFCKECNEPLYNITNNSQNKEIAIVKTEKKNNEKRQKKESKKKKIIKKARGIWDKFPGNINKKQKIFLAIIVPLAIFFIALSIAYNITNEYQHFRPGEGRVTDRFARGDYSIILHKPFDWGQTWHIWICTVVCVFFFEYKLFEDKK